MTLRSNYLKTALKLKFSLHFMVFSHSDTVSFSGIRLRKCSYRALDQDFNKCRPPGNRLVSEFHERGID